MEHGLPPERFGIKVVAIGPWPINGGKWQYTNMAIPTDECDLCKDRVEKGQAPTCVKHCQAQVLKYGSAQELARDLEDKPQQALFVP
jgi:anaerobic dimethyl sulfoxide reductase subunit B (iron-sulfur subunit)